MSPKATSGWGCFQWVSKPKWSNCWHRRKESEKRQRENTLSFICRFCSLLSERRAKECIEESGEIKRRERMVLYYMVCVCQCVCVCVLIVQAYFSKSIFSWYSFPGFSRVCFCVCFSGFVEVKQCVCRHKRSWINCTEEEKCPTCAVGGKLAQGQLMYRLSICTYFIPRLENKSCLCLGLPRLQQAIAAQLEWKTQVALMSFWDFCGVDRFNTKVRIKLESCSHWGQMSAIHYNFKPNDKK